MSGDGEFSWILWMDESVCFWLQWFRVGRHAFLGIIIKLLWLYGLTLCGPMRSDCSHSLAHSLTLTVLLSLTHSLIYSLSLPQSVYLSFSIPLLYLSFYYIHVTSVYNVANTVVWYIAIIYIQNDVRAATIINLSLKSSHNVSLGLCSVWCTL